MLGVSAQWLRDEANSGKLPCVKAGKRYLFNVTTVETILAERAATERLQASEG